MLTSLQLFILALIWDGVNTPYLLNIKAGVSVGAAIPALGSLTERKLVRRATAGGRGRMQYSLTKSGESILKRWKNVARQELKSGAVDLESALRFASLALAQEDKRLAITILSSAAQRDRTQQELEIPAEKTAASLYRWMRSLVAQSHTRANSQAVHSLLRSLRSRSR